ncbi:MAG TPA: lamin tail domain-containing protein, partial [Anaerolineales bacterium]|nr:lamin tail domain-containing protein [Anaerolineales bacterium]
MTTALRVISMKFSQRFWRGLVFFLLITALCGGLALPASSISVRAAPLMQAATDLVISEFRFRGSNGGNDEFIEIYNPTGSRVNLNGWMINGSNSGGTISNRYTFMTDIF